MIFNKILGNMHDIQNLEGCHIETIYLDSDDMLKKILRVTSDHDREYGISLDKGEHLSDGCILYNEGGKMIVVKINEDDVLIIKPKDLTEMGSIAHAIGNRHIPAQFENGEMIILYDSLIEDLLKNTGVGYSRDKVKLKRAFKHAEFAHHHH